MPVYIQEMSADVSGESGAGELPLTQAQIDMLVRIVLGRLQEQQRRERDMKAATAVRRESLPSSQV